MENTSVEFDPRNRSGTESCNNRLTFGTLAKCGKWMDKNPPK